MHRCQMMSMITLMSMIQILCSILCVAFTGCVSGETRPWQKITGPNHDAGLTLGDGGLEDSGRADVALHDDGGREIMTDRQVWLIVDDQTFLGSLRSTLDPPQTPVTMSSLDHLEAVRGVKPFILWRGPETSSDRAIQMALGAGHESAPIYVPQEEQGGRLNGDQLALELRYVESQILQDADALRIDDRPVLGLFFDPDRSQELQLILDELNTLEARPLVALFDVSPEAFEQFDGIKVSMCRGDRAADAQPRLDVRCVSPGLLPPVSGGFQRALIEARRQSDVSQRPLVIDGLGRWDGDRQIDPLLAGDSVRMTDAGITEPVPSYGTERLEAVQRLIQSANLGFGLQQLGDGPYLVQPGLHLQLRRDADGQVVFQGQIDQPASYVAILNKSPWRVEPETYVRYERSDPGVYLRAFYSDGHVSGPPSHGESAVCLRVGLPNNRRIEDLELVVSETVEQTRFEVSLMEVVSGRPRHCLD